MYGYGSRCQSCGAPLAADASFCSSCGTPASTGMPASGQPMGAPSAPPSGYGTPEAYPPPPGYAGAGVYGAPPMAAQMQRPSSGPIIAEVLLGLVGIFGVGWLAAGKTRTGLLLLAASIIWLVTAGATALHTFGVGCCGVVPLNILFIVLSAAMLNNAMRRG
jgi:hypothetical protein